jgi:hypothetical protein
VFKAKVSALIGLYAIGVFISFTLSQTGMLRKWLKSRGRYWLPKALVNGSGGVVTGIAVIIIAFTKFKEGAWVVVILIPILVHLMLKVKSHYAAVRKQLKLEPGELETIDIQHDRYMNRVIVPISGINKSSVRALKFAKTISDNVVAFSVTTDDEIGKEIRAKFNLLHTDIPLVIKYSPFRKVVEPLMKFIQSAEYDYQKGDMITVILPQFTLKRWWQKFLHNQTSVYIERQLLKHKHIVVATMPLQLKDDNTALMERKGKR